MGIKNFKNTIYFELRFMIYVLILLLGVAIALRSYTYSIEKKYMT